MPKTSKKFLDKKNSVTFHLVHRSQQDPLVADENAPQRVLLPIQDKSKLPKDPADRIKEQQKYGITFDDDYNYLQHLRATSNVTEWVPIETKINNTDEGAKIQLPSSVFASAVEEKIGLLNKAAPSGLRLDLDADIIAAMDEDFNYDDPDNELEDDFVGMANADNGCECSEDCESNDYSEEARDRFSSLSESEFSFTEEETKSRFTDYSITSSVIHRNSQLTLLDDRFEKMYSGYDDTEIGALDCEEIEGDISETSNILTAYVKDFQKQKQKGHLDKDLIALQLRLQKEYASSDEENDSNLIEMRVPETEKWDSESILTTYSNLYNHPKLIKDTKDTKIKINPKTGIPKNVLGTKKLTAKALLMLDQQLVNNLHDTKSVANSVTSLLSTLSIRNKHETSEEKKKRKHLLKEYRKERRLEKKINTQAFKQEKICQAKIAINVHTNLQGNKIL